ncbi:histidine kinase [Cytobacillus praedii]|nr:histidine kinase [Cytobacillus praedii]MED3551312.1 histidine kinase [Cytobacillus praedii]MED3573939.1 histidine kinase [Cytobacillus praedii]
MNKFTFVIPIMILVAVLAMWMLAKDYSEIDLQIRIIISAGAAILSGGISYFLFNVDKEKK